MEEEVGFNPRKLKRLQRIELKRNRPGYVGLVENTKGLYGLKGRIHSLESKDYIALQLLYNKLNAIKCSCCYLNNCLARLLAQPKNYHKKLTQT